MFSVPRLLRFGTRVVSHLPRSLCYFLAKLWGTLQFYQDTKRRSAVLKNLARIMPHAPASVRRARARRAFQIFAMNAVDFLLVPTLSRREILSMVEAVGDEPLDALRGQGYILLTAHLGNWDFAAGWVWARGLRGAAVAEMIDQDAWFQVFKDYRGRPGVDIVPLNVNPLALVRVLKRGGAVILLGDRDLTGHGFEAPFFTGRRRFPKGPGALAARLDLPVFPACLVRRNTRLTEKRPYLVMGWPLIHPRGRDKHAMNREVVGVLEEMVGRFPEQWFVFQDEWL